jgi:hypothetical protein
MNKKTTLIGGALAATVALLLPGIASASFLLDTGIPDGTGAPSVLNSSQWFAAEFSATAGQTISTVSAWLTNPTGQRSGTPNTFSFNIYSDSGFTGRSTSRVLLDSVQATYTADGWNSALLDWTPTTSGNYWLAIEVNTNATPKDQSNGLDLPQESSASTGTASAMAFAYLTSNTAGKFVTSSTAPTFGVQVSTVPLPAGVWLLGSGLLGLGALMRRQRTSSQPRPA